MKNPIIQTLHPIRFGLAAVLTALLASSPFHDSAFRTLRPAVLALALCLGGVLSATADDLILPPGVLSPTVPAEIQGRTYGQWSEAWWQWCLSLPVSGHPLFDTADVSAGQRGKVWFLGGTFHGGSPVRTGVIPPGKVLFFPILNNWADNTDCANGQRISDGFSVAALRAGVKAGMDGAQNLSCTIDGVPVQGLSDTSNSPYRVQTASPEGFNYSIPGQDSLPVAFGYACWSNTSGAPIRVDAKIYHPVGDGFYIMVAPLAPGSHTIHFHGEIPALGAVLDVTYSLAVSAHDDEGDGH